MVSPEVDLFVPDKAMDEGLHDFLHKEEAKERMQTVFKTAASV